MGRSRGQQGDPPTTSDQPSGGQSKSSSHLSPRRSRDQRRKQQQPTRSHKDHHTPSRRHQHSSSNSYPSPSPPRQTPSSWQGQLTKVVTTQATPSSQGQLPVGIKFKLTTTQATPSNQEQLPVIIKFTWTQKPSQSQGQLPVIIKFTTAQASQLQLPVINKPVQQLNVYWLQAAQKTKSQRPCLIGSINFVLLPSPAAYNATSNGVSMFHLINYYFP